MQFSRSLWLALLISSQLLAQSISSGTVTGTVTDQSGATLAQAAVALKNPVTGYAQSVSTDANGSFRINNVPPNNYDLTVSAPGFASATQHVDIRSKLPITANVSLKVASE